MSGDLAVIEGPHDIEVVAVPHPFSTKHIRMVVGGRATLEEIVRQAGVPSGCDARVFVEWKGIIYGPIPRAQWKHIRPRRGSASAPSMATRSDASWPAPFSTWCTLAGGRSARAERQWPGPSSKK